MPKYDHLTHDELVRLLEARDRRDAPVIRNQLAEHLEKK
jgi:hypothetical protein